MDSMKQFVENSIKTINLISEFESEKIKQLAAKIAESTMNGGIIHWFGSGHSMLLTKEVYSRAGTLTNSKPVSQDNYLGKFERVDGVGDALMATFDGLPGEVLVVVSSSGANPLPIDVALIGKSKGLYTAAITSMDHTNQVKSNHKSGKKLFEVVDLVLDTHAPFGDACLSSPDGSIKYGPLSTLAGVEIVHMLTAEVVDILLAKNYPPPIRISRNIPGGMEHNLKLVEEYKKRIPELAY
jgi:uncharacterized phosphosugar-binding protein